MDGEIISSLSSCVPGTGTHFSILWLQYCNDNITSTKFSDVAFHLRLICWKFGQNHARVSPQPDIIAKLFVCHHLKWLPKSYSVYQAVFQEWPHIFQYCCYTCVVRRKRTENPRFSTCPRWHFCCSHSRIYFGSGSFLISWKDQGWVFPTFEECAKLVGLPPRQSILHRWFIWVPMPVSPNGVSGISARHFRNNQSFDELWIFRVRPAAFKYRTGRKIRNPKVPTTS